MAIVYFTGFETGDAREIFSLGSGASVQSNIVRSGKYSLKNANTRTDLVEFTNNQLISAKFHMYVPVLPNTNTLIVLTFIVGPATAVAIYLKSTGQLLVNYDTISNATSANSILPGSWNKISFSSNSAAGGLTQLWLNDNLEISNTHTNATANTYRLDFSAGATPNEYYFDDVRIDTGILTSISSSKVIARQGINGIPTYDSWTKNGALTSALCWSDTPFVATSNCSTLVASNAQTTKIGKFSQRFSYYGNSDDIIRANDTINACKTALIVQQLVSGTPSIRRRVGGVDTDTPIAATTSDKYFDDGIWTTTTDNLDSLEAGVVHGVDVNLTTVEDIWVMVDYTPAAISPEVKLYTYGAGRAGSTKGPATARTTNLSKNSSWNTIAQTLYFGIPVTSTNGTILFIVNWDFF
jgi:hypothetical protein